jgi:hypothetical protein
MTGGEPGCYPGLSVRTTGSRRGGAGTRPYGNVVLGRDASQGSEPEWIPRQIVDFVDRQSGRGTRNSRMPREIF